MVADRNNVSQLKGLQETHLKPFLNHSTLLMAMLLVFLVATMADLL